MRVVYSRSDVAHGIGQLEQIINIVSARSFRIENLMCNVFDVSRTQEVRVIRGSNINFKIERADLIVDRKEFC